MIHWEMIVKMWLMQGSVESQPCGVSYYQQTMGCLMISFQSESIGPLYSQQGMRYTHCPTIEMSVNIASTMFGLASWIIQGLWFNPNPSSIYWLQFSVDMLAMKSLLSPEYSHQRCHNYYWSSINNHGSDVQRNYVIIAILAALLHKPASNTITTVYWKSASTECQEILVSHLWSLKSHATMLANDYSIGHVDGPKWNWRYHWCFLTSVSNSSNLLAWFQVRVATGTEPLQWVLPQQHPYCCKSASFTSENQAFQYHTVVSK